MYSFMNFFTTLGVHIGHSSSNSLFFCSWFLLCVRNDIWIIDLLKFIIMLKIAKKLLENIARLRAPIWFVNLYGSYKGILKYFASRCGEFFCANNWIRGMVSNFLSICVAKLSLFSIPQFVRKPSQLSFAEIFSNWFFTRNSWPRMLFITSTKASFLPVREALVSVTPSAAIVDTDTRTQSISCPIPGNDTAIICLLLYNQIICFEMLYYKFNQLINWFVGVRRARRLLSFDVWLENLLFKKEDINVKPKTSFWLDPISFTKNASRTFFAASSFKDIKEFSKINFFSNPIFFSFDTHKKENSFLVESFDYLIKFNTLTMALRKFCHFVPNKVKYFFWKKDSSLHRYFLRKFKGINSLERIFKGLYLKGNIIKSGQDTLLNVPDALLHDFLKNHVFDVRLIMFFFAKKIYRAKRLFIFKDARRSCNKFFRILRPYAKRMFPSDPFIRKNRSSFFLSRYVASWVENLFPSSMRLSKESFFTKALIIAPFESFLSSLFNKYPKRRELLLLFLNQGDKRILQIFFNSFFKNPVSRYYILDLLRDASYKIRKAFFKWKRFKLLSSILKKLLRERKSFYIEKANLLSGKVKAFNFWLKKKSIKPVTIFGYMKYRGILSCNFWFGKIIPNTFSDLSFVFSYFGHFFSMPALTTNIVSPSYYKTPFFKGGMWNCFYFRKTESNSVLWI